MGYYYVDWESALFLMVALSIIGVILSKKLSVPAVDWLLVLCVLTMSLVFDWGTLELIIEDCRIDAAVAILLMVCVPIGTVTIVNLLNFKKV